MRQARRGWSLLGWVGLGWIRLALVGLGRVRLEMLLVGWHLAVTLQKVYLVATVLLILKKPVSEVYLMA